MMYLLLITFQLGKSFFFRGCGWPSTKPKPEWSIEDKAWVATVNKLMDNLFGKDYLGYHYDKSKVCFVNEEYLPDFEYNRDEWEDRCYQTLNCTPLSPRSPLAKRGKKGEESQAEQKFKPGKRCLFPAPKANSCPLPSAVSAKQQYQPTQQIQSPVSIPKSLKPVQEPLKLCMSQTATRQELSQIKLPPVTNIIRETEVVPIFGNFQEDNPYSLKSRPSEHIMTIAHKIISTCSAQLIDGNTIQLDDEDDPSGVKIGTLGNFDTTGIDILLRYCSIAKMQHNFRDEMAWLHFNPDKFSLGETEIKYLCTFFESSPHDPLRVVTSLDGVNVDFKSVSTLVGERYIDNFIIDYCLKKSLINSQKQTKSTSSILCLPAEALSWLENQDLDPIKTVIQKDLHHPNELKLILMPVHMEDKHHWGLVCVDLDMVAIWYDDGLKVAPPENLCNSVGTLVKLLGDMFPSVADSMALNHFSTQQYKRMGMPLQRLDGKTAGGGSCGMGVILLGQDIIVKERVPPSRIMWTFEESNYYRKKLMLYMLT